MQTILISYLFYYYWKFQKMHFIHLSCIRFFPIAWFDESEICPSGSHAKSTAEGLATRKGPLSFWCFLVSLEV